MNVILYIVAYILVATLTPIGFVYGIIRSPKYVGRKLRRMSISLDQFGNVVMCELFDDILGDGFGNEDETISSRLGALKKAGRLKPIGKAIAYILNKIDNNHVEKAIE